MHGRCQKCGTVELQGNKWICPACAYQPTEQELERANFAFNELKKRLAEVEAQYREGAGLSLEHSLWRMRDSVQWWEDREYARRKEAENAG